MRVTRRPVRAEHARLQSAKGRGIEQEIVAQRGRVRDAEARLRAVGLWIKGRNVAKSAELANVGKRRRDVLVRSGLGSDYAGEVLEALLEVVARMEQTCPLTSDERALVAHARDVAKVALR